MYNSRSNSLLTQRTAHRAICWLCPAAVKFRGEAAQTNFSQTNYGAEMEARDKVGFGTKQNFCLRAFQRLRHVVPATAPLQPETRSTSYLVQGGPYVDWLFCLLPPH